MRKKIILTPIQKRKINKTIADYKAFKKIGKLLNTYNGKSFKILKIKQLVKNKLK
jgi:uncharacterized protein YprB with RNaseH-like and TPR domain